ncbi:MAG TPA: fimbrial protein [Lelliottia sp.]|jgi:type 1 fimbria pilin
MFKTDWKFVYLALGLILFILHPLRVQAAEPACESQGGYYVAHSDVQMANDAPAGSSSSAVMGNGSQYTFACPMVTSGVYRISFKVTVDATPVSGFTDVYPTDAPGIGVRFHFQDDSNLCDIKYGDTIENASRVFSCTLSSSTNPMTFISSAIELVKTNRILTGGQVRQLPVVKTSYHMEGNAEEYTLNPIWSGSSMIYIDMSPCGLTTHSSSVNLADVAGSSFTGEGSTAGDKSFTVSLTCTAGNKISLSLQGTKNKDVSDTSVLALTDDGAPGVATGIGVQILTDGTPLKLNDTINLATAAGGDQDFTFVARYIQTKPTVGEGTANSVATLDLTFQ